MASAKRHLLKYEYQVFSTGPVLDGQPPEKWTASHFLPCHDDRSDYLPKPMSVIGVDVTGVGQSPVFEGELLRDGYTSNGRIARLLQEMRDEDLRLSPQPDTQKWRAEMRPLKAALADLKPLMLRLHGHGYSISDLQRLVVGSLRVSVDQDEIAEVLFPGC
jgi:hypothetical protein